MEVAEGTSNYLLETAMVLKPPEHLCILQVLSTSSACSCTMFLVASSLIPSRRQVIILSLWRVRSSRPPIRRATCCAVGILRCSTGRRGLTGRVHAFCSWMANRVRHSRSSVGISGRGITDPGIGRPSERTPKQNWWCHIARRWVMD